MKFLFVLLFINVITCNLIFAKKADTIPKFHKLQINANGSLNITPLDRVYLLNNQIGYSFTKDRVELNSNAKWIYGFNNSGLVNNDFTGTLDGNFFHDTEKRFNSWILGSFVSSYSLRIISEYQGGAGVAYLFFDDKKNKTFNLKISNGLIIEESHFYNPENIQSNYNILRNSLKVNFKLLMLNKRITMESATMWQPALNKANDYNFRTSATLNIPIWEFLSLQTRYEYNFITRTQRENTLLNYGITAKFNF